MGFKRQADRPEPVVADPRDQLVLDEARRGIDQQREDLQGLRNRAGATVGYATVVASVLAGLSLRNNANPTNWTWAGLAAFGLAATLSAFVLAPRTLTLVLNVEQMDNRIDEGDALGTMMRDTSLALHRDHEGNQRVLKRLHRAYLLSLIAVLAEVGLLLTDLARR